ncbi:hypothetical protein Clacol_001066 [Clathrus columnatus]|uniref:Uncharacterized protein n=1 Tax=Clathrus columnatus TaxID=1419009 RepID=A0AAV4ZYE1_9AGAM|nr:hypothetical protein Clacol_001066 [Clathrus columnatus]
MSSVSEIQVQQPINPPRIIPGHLQLSSDTDTTTNTSFFKEYNRYYSETASETASTLSSSITATSPSSTNTELESISSLELSPPEVRIEIIENAIPEYLEGNDGELLDPLSERDSELDDNESEDSVEYQDVDIYTDEASDGGSLQWDERASISDTDAVYSFEEVEEEF